MLNGMNANAHLTLLCIKDATIRCSVAVVAVLKMPSNNQNIFLYLYIYKYIYKYRVNSDIITTYF